MMGLTLAELIAPSRLLLTELLPFHTPWIPSQQSGSFQSWSELWIQFDQRAGNAQLGCFSLSLFATTGSIDFDVILSGTLYSFDGKFHLVLQIYLRKIFFVILIIHGDVAIPLAEEYPGYRFFPATQSVFFCFSMMLVLC